jgi:hypothetical protein
VDSLEKKIRQEIGLIDSESLTLDEVSVCLQLLAKEDFKLKQASTEDLRALCLNRSATFSFLTGPKVPLFTDEYLSRVRESLNEILLNPSAPLPFLRVSFSSMAAEQITSRYAEAYRLGIIFTAESTTFQDILHSLQNDAYDASTSQAIELLGVRESWLIEKEGHLYTRRALIVDAQGLVIDQVFETSVAIDAGWILHLRRENESQAHQRITKLFQKNHTLLINPYNTTVEITESKYRTCLCWANHLKQPESYLITQGMAESEIKKILPSNWYNQSVFLLPDKGTEGIGAGTLIFDDGAYPKISRLSGDSDIILRESRGNVFFFDQDFPDAGYRPVVIRANVFYADGLARTESGYLLASGSSQEAIASVFHGGQIISLDKLESHLFWKNTKGEYLALKLRDKDFSLMGKTAALGMSLLNQAANPQESLLFAGIDLLLEYDEENGLIPVLLEINPRPSGLTHARDWNEKSPRPLMVSKYLFEYIVNHQITRFREGI